MTGQSIPLPQHHPAPAPPVPPAPVPHFASTSVQPLAMSNHHSTAIVPADYAQNESSIEKDYNIAFDPSSKRWPKPEVLALIKLRTSLDQRFHEPGSKAVLWEEISNSMAAQGYNRTPKRCKEKWENINKYFKKAKESNKKRPENAKTCPYFHHLNALYKEGLLGGGSSTDTSSGKQLLSAEKMEPGKSNHGIVSNHGEGSMQTQGDPDVFLKQHDNAVTNPVSGNANAMTIATTANLTLRPSSSSTPSAETKMHLFMVGERGDIKEHAGMVKNIGVTSSSDINAGSQPIGDLSTGTNSRASLAMASGNSRSFNLDVQAGASNRNLPSAPIIKQPDRSQT
ncbi:hypothetical protein KP509_26G053100 [Ceratopteris richardii]|nr:hypothetical protein KP509_26G053100 [Ceratopteris richardii]